MIGKFRTVLRSDADVIADARALAESMRRGEPSKSPSLDADLITELADRLEGKKAKMPPSKPGEHRITFGYTKDDDGIWLECSSGHRECLGYGPTVMAIFKTARSHHEEALIGGE